MKKRITVATICALVLSLLNLPSAHAGQVTTGLLIDLNASNPNSYPGTGTTWIDLAGGDDTATLTNGPIFSNSGGNGFTNDGVDDYENIPDRSVLRPVKGSCTTAMLWAKVLTATASRGLIGKQYGGGNGWDGYSLYTNGTNGLTMKMNGIIVDQNISSLDNVYTTGTWTLFTYVTCLGGGAGNPNKVYVNSTNVISSANADSGISYATAPITIGWGIRDYSEYSSIKVGAFAFYDRALTDQQISDSYDYYLNYVYVAEASTVSLSATNTAYKGNSVTITATLGAAGAVRFFYGGKRIAGCLRVATSASPYTATCTFKPNAMGSKIISATLTPTNGGLSASTASRSITVLKRSTLR